MSDVAKLATEIFQKHGLTALFCFCLLLLCALAVWLVWRDGKRCHAERVRQAESLLELHRDMAQTHFDVINRNTAALSLLDARLTSAVTELGRRLHPS